MHGGTIAARSDGPGKGSELSVHLPLLRDAPPTASPGTISGQPPPPVTPRRVLVVDDNVDAAESAAMVLRLWSHDVRVAFNGADALALMDEYDPDIVLLDIGLPGITGYELARRIRAQPRFENTVLVAVTGYGQEGDRLRSQHAGFDHHLTKPMHPSKLQEIMATSRGAV
jgi:CheY-like chemotaxis protein